MNKNKYSDYIKFIAFILCFVGIPLGMAFTGYYYTFQSNKSILEKKLSNEINAFYTKLEPFADQQKFWISILENTVANYSKKGKNNQETANNIVNNLTRLQKDYEFEYIVFNPTYGAIADIASDTLGGNLDEIKKAVHVLWKFQSLHSFDISLEDQEILGKVFGPQFFVNHLNSDSYDKKGASLCWTDSLYKRRLIWNIYIHKFLVLVFLKQKYLDDLNCIKTYLDNSVNELTEGFGFSIKNTNNNSYLHLKNEKQLIEEIEKASFIYEKDHFLEVSSDNYYIYPYFLRPGLTIYGYFDKSKINNIKPSVYWVVCLLLVSILCILLSIYGWKVIILHRLIKVSIKWKLIFLFFFANGLPLLVLIFIGNDFLRQARNEYIQQKIEEGTSFLQDFDEKYELEYARAIIRKEKIKRDIIKRRGFFGEEELEDLYNGISSDTWCLFVIASEGQTLLRNSDGIFNDGDLKKNSSGSYKGEIKYSHMKSHRFDNHLSTQIEFSQKLGYYMLNKFNNKTIDTKKAAEVELILESVLRKKLDLFIYDIFVKLGNYMPVGLGQNVHPALFDYISIKNNEVYDYFMFSTLKTESFQNNYFNKVISKANRNEIGLKVIVWNPKLGFSPKKEKSLELESFRQRLNSYPVNQPIIINHNKTDYIAMGFDCKHIVKSKLIGLYPLFLIDEQVLRKRNELIIFSIMSLIVTLTLSSIIIKSFLAPLSVIYTGAKSIEQKNFQHRLPKLGRDEFGAIGKIFNEVIVDLEELSVAGAIQEQLLPNSEIKTGHFSLYGKSVAMGELGGDYFDFIEMEDNKFAVALGDVAGHGVGASLIMAMAKAGLITLDSLLITPQKLIERLHEMIYKSKTQNQRKIMTFQYMYLDGESGEALYSNAGGCSPFIIRKSSGIVEELKLPGAVLGAFKKGKFTETSVKFESGDAIVFYSDGIVECKDEKGTVLGYDNLKILLQKCWNENAEKFYNNIYQSYLEYIGGQKADAEDDVTIVVLVFNKSSVVQDNFGCIIESDAEHSQLVN